MGHRIPQPVDDQGRRPEMTAQVAADVADAVAQMMQTLATASRVRILAQLREGPHLVGELAAVLDMEQSAVSHQLRMLRHLGLVTGSRRGRNVLYALHDQHIATLLHEAIGHAEHVKLGIADAVRDDGRVTVQAR